jgi:hypothetical protein
VTSRVTPSFWRCYRALSRAEQRAARRAYKFFAADPSHPSLHFKKLAGHADLWSVRATISVRAVGHRDGDTVTWVWIGRHGDFDNLFS